MRKSKSCLGCQHEPLCFVKRSMDTMIDEAYGVINDKDKPENNAQHSNALYATLAECCIQFKE